MRQKHNKGAEQENKNKKHTLKNTTVRMLVKTEKISSSLRRRPWRRYVLRAFMRYRGNSVLPDERTNERTNERTRRTDSPKT